MQLDCCLQHAMNFWRNAALPLNCSTTESPRTQKLFSYLALLQNGNFCNKGRIISHTRSYCNAHSCYCLPSLIPAVLMKGVRTKFTWQGKRTSGAERSLWSSPLHVRYTPKVWDLFLCKIPGRNISAAGPPTWGSRVVGFLSRGSHMRSSNCTPKTRWSISPG